MKTNLRKALALLLCLLMLLSMIPAAGFAEEEYAEAYEDVYEENDDLEDASVRVSFACDPAEAEIIVYDPAQADEFGEMAVIAPEEDGTWLLLPGEYFYDARCDYYTALEKEAFTVWGPDEELVEIYLEPLLTLSGTEEFSSDFVAYGSCGDNLTWTLDDEGTLTITGSGEMWTYPGWDNRKNSIVSVVINSGVTSIGEHAFESCSNLTSVTIPDSVTSIGNSAFSGTGLTSVAIPASVTSIENYAFYCCANLASITVDPDNTAYCETDGILYTKDLSELILCPMEKTGTLSIPSGVETIGLGAFHGCSGLTGEVVIPAGVTWILDFAFMGCSGLTSIVIPSSVMGIGDDVFEGCTGLTSLTLPEEEPLYGFGFCAFAYTGLTSVIIPDGWETIYDSMFSYCTSLTSVTIPDSVTSIEKQAFYNCTSLTDVNYGGTETQWTALQSNIGSGNTPLTDATIHYTTATLVDSGTWGDLSWTLDSDGKLSISGTGTMNNFSYPSTSAWHAYESSIKAVEIESGVTSIGELAFFVCRNIESVTLPESLTSIGRSAFNSCSSLESVTLPSGLTSIEALAFANCGELLSIEIPASVTNIESEALNNPSLTSIIVNESNQSYSDLDGVLFNKLQTEIVCVPGSRTGNYTIPESVTTIGNSAFGSCKSLQSIVIPESVTTVGNYAFSGCESLQSIIIPDSVTTIGRGAFSECKGLQSISIPGSVTTIDQHTLSECTSLTDVTFLDGVKQINDSAFSSCQALTTITIPVSMEHIVKGAFFSCPLSDVYYGGTEEQWKLIKFTDGLNGSFALDYAAIHYTTPSVVDSGVCGDNLTWSLDVDGLMTISGTGEMYDYEDVDSVPWIDYIDQISALLLKTSAVLNTSVSSIGSNAFSGCTGLTSATIPTTVTSIGENAFNACDNLTDVYYIGTEEQWNALCADGIADGNDSLTNATINYTTPSTIASGTCGGNLTWTLNIEGTLTISGTGTMDNFFSRGPWDAYGYGDYIDSLIIRNGVTSIGEYAFRECKNLESLTIPAGVTSIGCYAFYGCSGLSTVTMPVSVTSIDNHAFGNCTSLTDVYYGGTEAQWNQISIGSGNTPLTSATIHFAYIGRIYSIGANLADAMDLKFYVTEIPEGVEPHFAVTLADRTANPTLTQAENNTAYALANESVYTVSWDQSNSRWVIRVKIFPKWISSPFTLQMTDAEGEPLYLKGYASQGVGSKEVALSHSYSFLDYLQVMSLYRGGKYTQLYNQMQAYGELMKDW